MNVFAYLWADQWLAEKTNGVLHRGFGCSSSSSFSISLVIPEATCDVRWHM